MLVERIRRFCSMTYSGFAGGLGLWARPAGLPQCGAMNPKACFVNGVVALGLLGGWAQVQAQAPAPVSDCADYVDDRARLACYDRVHGRPVRSDAASSLASPLAVQPTSPSPRPTAPGADQLLNSHLAERWDLRGHTGELFAPRAYRPVYMLPATWTDRVNRTPGSPSPDHTVPAELELRAIETKYQISLKAKLLPDILGLPVSLWGGYTQSSRWQVYNGADRKSTRLNSSHLDLSRMPSSA